MKYIEVVPLPKECEGCTEDDCYECDFAGKRWVLSERDNLLLKRQLAVQAISRFQKEIEKIDKRLAELGDNEKGVLNNET